MIDDEPLRKRDTITPGEDLSLLGIEQLSERVRVLEHEIERARAAIETKTEGRASAEALFRKS